MKYIKFLFLVFLITACAEDSFAQFFALTSDVIRNTKYVRKKQEAHSISSAFLENNDLIINFTATLDKKSKRKPYHIRVPIDSVMSYYRDKPSFQYTFDSAAIGRYNVSSIEKHYNDLPGGQYGHIVEIMCVQNIIDSGFYTPATFTPITDSIEIIDGKEELYTFEYKSRTYLHGQHIVFLYKIPKGYKTDGSDVKYIVLNIENSPRIDVTNYMKLPGTIIIDLISLPFVLMTMGMEK